MPVLRAPDGRGSAAKSYFFEHRSPDGLESTDSDGAVMMSRPPLRLGPQQRPRATVVACLRAWVARLNVG